MPKKGSGRGRKKAAKVVVAEVEESASQEDSESQNEKSEGFVYDELFDVFNKEESAQPAPEPEKRKKPLAESMDTDNVE